MGREPIPVSRQPARRPLTFIPTDRPPLLPAWLAVTFLASGRQYPLAMYMGGLGRLAVWYLSGGPVGPPSRWAATSNVEVGPTAYPLTGQGWKRGEKGGKDKVTKKRRGKEEWNRGTGPRDH